MIELDVFFLHGNSNTFVKTKLKKKKHLRGGFVYSLKEFLGHCNWMHQSWFSYCCLLRDF